MDEIIGFIGLGVMGKPMARHLLKAGIPRSSSTTAAAAPWTSSWRPAPRPPTRRPRSRGRPTVVITMVPDTPDVEQVLTGPDGVLSALQPGAVVIDMSSISPVGDRAARGAGRAKGRRRCSTRR